MRFLANVAYAVSLPFIALIGFTIGTLIHAVWL